MTADKRNARARGRPVSTKNAKHWSLSVNPFQSLGQPRPGKCGKGGSKTVIFQGNVAVGAGSSAHGQPIVWGGAFGAPVWPNRCEGNDSAPNTGAQAWISARQVWNVANGRVCASPSRYSSAVEIIMARIFWRLPL